MPILPRDPNAPAEPDEIVPLRDPLLAPGERGRPPAGPGPFPPPVQPQPTADEPKPERSDQPPEQHGTGGNPG